MAEYVKPGVYRYTGVPFTGVFNLSNDPEPFVVWNKLIGLPKEHEFSKSLQASTHDPLWFISRQWQLGEFKGENAGTPISVKASVESRSMTHYSDKDSIEFKKIAPIPNDKPLEVMVEALEFKLNLMQIADMGRFYISLLREINVNETKITILAESPEFGLTK